MTIDPKALEDHEVGLLDVDDAVHERIELGVEEGGESRLSPKTFSKLSGAAATLMLLIGLTYFVPGLDTVQPWRADEEYVPFWNLIGRELMGQGARIGREAAELDQLEEMARRAEALNGERAEVVADREVVEAPVGGTFPPYTEHADDAQPIVRELEFVEHLEPFFVALTRTDLGYAGAVTRAGHWGDSVLGNDGITAAIRGKLQARFGDAGHGFHSLSRYNMSYRHKGIGFNEKSKWGKCVINLGCRADGHYGYGGVTVRSSGGAESRFWTAKKGAVGRKVSRFELWYAAQPNGGNLRIKVDGLPGKVIETAADALEDRWETIVVPSGPHAFGVRAMGGGRVRAYGVVLEREGPGVVWDGMAIIGSFVARLSNYDAEHLARQLTRRDPDLLVFTFGGNDMLDSSLRRNMEKHEEKYGAVVEAFRAAKPDAACLIISPVDHGERKGGRIVSRPIVAPMVEAQRAVALRHGCAFFDLYAAMGGEGSMGRWYQSNPRLGNADLAHPTAAGHKVIGELVYRGLMKGYADFRARSEGKPMP